MGHLDKRMDPDPDPPKGEKTDNVKDGVSGNVPETAAYEQNKHVETAGASEPDVVEKAGGTPPTGRPR